MWMVFLPRVLRVVVEPVEQSVQLMVVMIVQKFQVGVVSLHVGCGSFFSGCWNSSEVDVTCASHVLRR